MHVIVGLGNPGRQYDHTRHNVGFEIILALAARHNIVLGKSRCKAIVGEGIIEDKRVALCLPQTYMNLSGESVSQLRSWYKPEMDELLVCYDDVDLPTGKLRFRPDGSAGTHNGMRDIIEKLGRQDFPRFRVGTGRPPEGWELKDYVLSRFQKGDEEARMREGYEKAAEAIEVYLREGKEKTSVFVGKK